MGQHEAPEGWIIVCTTDADAPVVVGRVNGGYENEDEALEARRGYMERDPEGTYEVRPFNTTF